jgi:hypothetical protein
LIGFGLLITADAVTIVAHFPYTTDVQEKSISEEIEAGAPGFVSAPALWTRSRSIHRYSGYVVGVEIRKGPAFDEAWIVDRLRLFLALLVIAKNSQLISAMWDDIHWPREIEDVLEKQHAQWDRPTPNPSEENEDTNPVRIMWEKAIERMEVEENSDDEGRLERVQVALEVSRPRILAWRNSISYNLVDPK